MVSTTAGLVILAIIFIVYLAVVYWKNKTSVVFADEKEGFVVQTPAMVLGNSYNNSAQVAGGPSTPSEAPSTREVIYHSEESPCDPSESDYESSEMPERLRHPERAFRPAPGNTETDMAMAAGIAGQPDPSQLQQSQMFSAEMAENGGEIMPGIFANDTMAPTNFSGF